MSIKDGGPAFPRQGFWNTAGPELFIQPNPGMSLRAWLAGQMAPAVRMVTRIHDPAGVARLAVADADALIAELEKEPTT